MNHYNNQQDISVQDILEHALDGIITLNEKGEVLSINSSALAILNISDKEVMGIKLQELLELSWDDALKEIDTSGSFKKEISNSQAESQLICLLVLSKVKAEDRILYTGVLHDVTHLRALEKQLFESEKRLNSIIENAVDGIITINERGIVDMVNPSAAKMFGYRPEEVVGQNIKMLMPPPDKHAHDKYIANYIKTGHKKIIGIGREVTGLKKNGETFPFRLSVSEINLSGKKAFAGIIHDITEQKNAEEQLRRYADELMRSNRDLEDFAYVSSHDLQEPLRKIQAFGDRLFQMEKNNLGTKSKDYLERMLSASSRMQKLINDLLTYSRVTTKTQPFKLIDLNAVAEHILTDLEVSIENTGAHIEVSKLPVIEADELQMQQLFLNLVSNSLKFIHQDRPPKIKIWSEVIRKSKHLTNTTGNEFVKLYFQDNGIGFDAKYTDRIFNIFQRLEGQQYGGSGIGLAICKKIAGRHGGSIEAHSEPGEGAVFSVILSTKQTKKKTL